MLKNMDIQLLGDSPTNPPIKIIKADIQEPEGVGDLIIDIEEFKFSISKIITVGEIEPLIDMRSYVKVNNLIYKVLKIKTIDNKFMEVYLYLLERQVV